MRQIWKYLLSSERCTTIWIPKGFEILSLQTQRDEPTIWALVDPEESQIRIDIMWVMTGEDFKLEHGEYLGTILFQEGFFVVHYFMYRYNGSE